MQEGSHNLSHIGEMAVVMDEATAGQIQVFQSEHMSEIRVKDMLTNSAKSKN